MTEEVTVKLVEELVVVKGNDRELRKNRSHRSLPKQRSVERAAPLEALVQLDHRLIAMLPTQRRPKLTDDISSCRWALGTIINNKRSNDHHPNNPAQIYKVR